MIPCWPLEEYPFRFSCPINLSSLYDAPVHTDYADDKLFHGGVVKSDVVAEQPVDLFPGKLFVALREEDTSNFK